MTIAYSGDSITFPDNSVQNTAATGFGFKSRIINGACVIDQRNAGASVTPASNNYTLDRWAVTMGAASKFSLQQVTDAPVGFYNSLKITTISAYATATYFDLYQRIEGHNWNDMSWGTANAKAVTLSAWVKSSVIGTYTGFIRSNDSGVDASFSYTISSANTWTYITANIAGQTTGNWGGTNGIGASLFFDFPNIIPTLSATFYITGVQLEKGSTATSFDYRPYGTELALCQRYYQNLSGGVNYRRYVSNVDRASSPLTVVMRSSPTLVRTWNSSTGLNADNSSATATALTFDMQFTGSGTGVIDLGTATVLTLSAEL